MAITFDPATVLDVVLSGGNLTGTNNNTVNPMGCKGLSSQAKSSGKWYFEMVGLATNGGAQNCVALAEQSRTYSDIVTNAGSGTGAIILFQGSSGVVFANGSFSGIRIIGAGTINPTDVIGIAVDLDNMQWWGKDITNGAPYNDNGAADPSSNLHGIAFTDNPVVPWFGWGGSGVTTNIAMTANFTGPFVGSIPGGFQAWDNAVPAHPYSQGRIIT